MSTKLVFTKNSLLNTSLIDEASGVVMYEIETGGGLFSKTTVIRKPSQNQRGGPAPRTSTTDVAKIEWKAWSSDRIVYRGQDMNRDEFLPKAGIFSDDYLITVNGKQYRWSAGSPGSGGELPKLVTVDKKKAVIAELHRAHHFFRKRKAFLEVAVAGSIMLDHIVVSLVYVESKRRERGEPSVGGGGGGN